MVKKYSMSFRQVDNPITAPVTKFGGQPNWLAEPQWPLSRATGELMRFLGQFRLYEDIFGPLQAQMAYLFMTDGDIFVDGTWEPDAGENAVVLQPGKWSGPSQALATGPTLMCVVLDHTPNTPREESCEYAVDLTLGDDPDVLDENTFRARNAWDDYCDYVDENKIGGVAAFLQHPEYPAPGKWRLLAQIQPEISPSCSINFGDAGVGYVFLAETGDQAKFLWQCG